jgi:N-acetylmuramoyl-L-alanine amidase
MRTKINYILILVLAAVFSAGGAEVSGKTSKGAASLLEKADRCRISLYRSAAKKKYRHNWLNCIHLYEKVPARYPESDQAAWAIYHSARIYTSLYSYARRYSDLDEAVGLYKSLAEKYKDHRLADDAQYRIGEIYYKYKKDLTQAYVEFLKVDIRFPSGDMRPKARKMLDELAMALGRRDEKKNLEKSGVSQSVTVEVKDIRHWSTPSYTRVVFDLDNQVKYKHHLLKADPDNKKPRRLYLDLDGSRITPGNERQVDIKDGLLKRVRAAQYTKDAVRVVLDMESIGGYKVFHLHDPFRIVVDVRRQEEPVVKEKHEPALKERPVLKGFRKAEVPDKTASLAKQLGLNVRRIVIDPGHGGKDPGCNIRGSVKEKNIVLSIARLLAEKIKKKIGCEVILTRNKDTFISLEQRTAIANIKKADLFVSLHINAHRNKNIWGLETYFLNMATDERAVMVAARENATSEKNISDLQTILNDLMLNTKIHESSRLAHEVQEGMMSRIKKSYKKAKSLGVKQAPFYVLIGAQMPAILVETGFLTNPTEKKRLMSKKYQENVAEGICQGIHAYIKSIEQTG